MNLRKLSTIVDTIGSNSDISRIKNLLIYALKSESGAVLKAKINGVEVTTEKEEDSLWDPDFGSLDYSVVVVSADGFTTEISKEEEIEFAISLLYDTLKLKPSTEEVSLITEVQKVLDIEYLKLVTFDDNVYVITEFGERVDKDLLENVGFRFVEEKIMPNDVEMAYTIFKFTNNMDLRKLSDSYKLSKCKRNTKQKVSDSNPDYTNTVIYDLESEGKNYSTAVDDNVLYLYKELEDVPRGQLWIDKFGKVHIDDFSNDEPLNANERKILEELAEKAKGRYNNGYTDADISLWAIEKKFTTPHKIENSDGYWAITFDEDPSDSEIKLMKQHHIEFDEDYDEWA